MAGKTCSHKSHEGQGSSLGEQNRRNRNSSGNGHIGELGSEKLTAFSNTNAWINLRTKGTLDDIRRCATSSMTVFLVAQQLKAAHDVAAATS